MRRAIVRVFAEKRSEGALAVLSPKEVASLLEVPLPNVSYHIRTLVGCGAITLVEIQQVRGSLEHRYKADLLLQEPWVRGLLKVMKQKDEKATATFRGD